jgi:hypothetical protein
MVPYPYLPLADELFLFLLELCTHLLHRDSTFTCLSVSQEESRLRYAMLNWLIAR